MIANVIEVRSTSLSSNFPFQANCEMNLVSMDLFQNANKIFIFNELHI